MKKFNVGIDNKNKQVVCVFKPTKWHIVEGGPDEGKKYFSGEEIPLSELTRFENSIDIFLSKFGNVQSMAYASLADMGD